MDELHARVRAFRSPPTERNLAKQPYPEFDDFDDSEQAQRQGEANVVEMPQRQANEAVALNPTEQSQAPRATTQRKQGAAAKRQSIANQNAFSFRQLRDGHQQPYIDELKRLEAQAERINQLLADRKRKQASAEQAAGRTTDEPPVDTERLPKATPKKTTTKRTKQPSKPTARSPQREVLPMSAHDDDTDALEAQAERIKQLLHELETALADGAAPPEAEAIAHESEPSSVENSAQTAHPASASRHSTSGVDTFAASTYRYGGDALPFAINQMQTITGATDQQAQQEATETAQALRYLASREPMEPPIAPPPYYEPRRHSSRSRDRHAPLMQRYGLRLRQLLQMPQKTLDRLGDAVLWIVLAAAIRVGARLVVAQFPALTPILLVLLFAPAAVAVYLALCMPKAGFVSFYRLFLIMLGLLLGGRF